MINSGNVGSIGAVLVVIASTSHYLDIAKRKGSAAISRETSASKARSPIAGKFDFQMASLDRVTL